MSELFPPRVGAVYSADVAVPEHDREVRFYSRILRTGDSPLWREDLMNNIGIPIIGLGARSPEYAELPLQWMPHIQVADVNASVERAVASSGSVLMHQRNDSGESEWAVLLDPNGAAFGLIPEVPSAPPPASGSAPAGADARVGRIFWLDLTVPDAVATRDFYQTVIGWSVEDVEMRDGSDSYADFSMLDAEGSPAAGVCHARGTNLGLPPVWMIYLPVGDLVESIRRVEEEGGKVLKAVRARDGEYMYAAIEDPVGVRLGLVQG